MPIGGQDLTDALVERVRRATASRTPLRIVGGDTKRFYGRPVAGEPLEVAGHAGVLNYDPAELVVTVRAGTRLRDLQDLLHRDGQRLPFEPPAFGAAATVGGTVAAGLAGPARVARGAVRDFVLGAKLLTGDGRVLRFGGEVMKNVAGYDVSRLLAGSLGILGVILEVSLKVLPSPAGTRTLRGTIAADEAIAFLASSTREGMPVTASFWSAGELHVRLEGSQGALDEAAAIVGGETLAPEAATRWWSDVCEQRLAHFTPAPAPLWRLHVPSVAPVTSLAPYESFAFEWNGLQRWVGGIDPATAHRIARECGGHAACFRGGAAGEEVFAPLPHALLELHRKVKRVFDPAAILNPGRMYAAL
ncbi:MAG TPA: glycolate oxidase subunit GlcE [Steroidobacteraceae bacterium]|nr:glycolate oxidase subunit GlcE [Steroidobacteraceae bacterium]